MFTCIWLLFVQIFFQIFLNFAQIDSKFERVGDTFARIDAGHLQGWAIRLKEESRNATAYVFKKIPYAEPPLGDLRFSRLRKKISWRGILNATEYGPKCMTTRMLRTTPLKDIDEDCIFANIFVDSRCFEGRVKCPVLVYFYGGALNYVESAPINDAEILRRYATDEIVFVYVAYRVGIFGFIDSPGTYPNLGFDDAIFALNWTRNEIGNFGGDPNRITLLGYSAGAYLSYFLHISPAVPRELFRSSILISVRGRYSAHGNRVHTLEILRRVGCIQSSESVYRNESELDCLRKIDAHTILNAQAAYDDTIGDIWRIQHYLQPSIEQFPAPDEAALRREYFTPRPLLISTTQCELAVTDVTELCAHVRPTFGYRSRRALHACLARYRPLHFRATVLRAVMPEKGECLNDYDIDVDDAALYLIALTNARRGGASYSAYVTMAGHRTHYGDRVFFDALRRDHDGILPTSAERLMDDYYPAMIKRFVKTDSPDQTWKPVDPTTGKGYFELNFEVDSESGNITRRPTFHEGVPNPNAVHFWAVVEPRIELEEMNET